LKSVGQILNVMPALVFVLWDGDYIDIIWTCAQGPQSPGTWVEFQSGKSHFTKVAECLFCKCRININFAYVKIIFITDKSWTFLLAGLCEQENKFSFTCHAKKSLSSKKTWFQTRVSCSQGLKQVSIFLQGEASHNSKAAGNIPFLFGQHSPKKKIIKNSCLRFIRRRNPSNRIPIK